MQITGRPYFFRQSPQTASPMEDSDSTFPPAKRARSETETPTLSQSRVQFDEDCESDSWIDRYYRTEKLEGGYVRTAQFRSKGRKYFHFTNCMQDYATHMVVEGDSVVHIDETAIPLEYPGVGAQESVVLPGILEDDCKEMIALGVFDGHGIPGGDVAAQTAKAVLEDCVIEWEKAKKRVGTGADVSFESAITDGFDAAHARILGEYPRVLQTASQRKKSASREQLRSRLEFGTTAAVIVLDRMGMGMGEGISEPSDADPHTITAHIANCGDSEIVLGRTRSHGHSHDHGPGHSHGATCPETGTGAGNDDTDMVSSSLPLPGASTAIPRSKAVSASPAPPALVVPVRLTQVHNASTEAEAERLTEAGMSVERRPNHGYAFRTPAPTSRGIMLSRSLGHKLFAEYGVCHTPFVTETVIHPSTDKVLICATDGLWEALGFDYERVVNKAMQYYPDPVAAAHALGALATKRPNTDNTVFIVCFF